MLGAFAVSPLETVLFPVKENLCMNIKVPDTQVHKLLQMQILKFWKSNEVGLRPLTYFPVAVTTWQSFIHTHAQAQAQCIHKHWNGLPVFLFRLMLHTLALLTEWN